jgi:hypothetical protein
VALGCAAVALTSSPVLAQEVDKFQEQQHTTFYNGNPVYTPGNASSAAPAGSADAAFTS